jgi:hypothetical protein
MLWGIGIGSCASADAADWSGRWAARSVDRVYEVVSIRPGERAGGSWRVAIDRPKGSWLDPGGMVERLGGVPVHEDCRVLSESADALEIVEPAEGRDGTRYHLSKLDDGHLVLMIVDAGVELLLERARPGESVSSDWPHEAVTLIQRWPDNAEMTALFDSDQAYRDQVDRESAHGRPIDMTAMRVADEARRTRAQALIDAGALHSGADFYHAAFVFQHGEGAPSHLKAHALAIAAAARGYGAASWIAAASLDRYLTDKGEPQIFGTQYPFRPGGAVTQEPYDRTLLTDGLRAAVGVRSLASQEERRKAYETRRQRDRAVAASAGQ